MKSGFATSLSMTKDFRMFDFAGWWQICFAKANHLKGSFFYSSLQMKKTLRRNKQQKVN